MTLTKLTTQEQINAFMLLCREFLAESRYGNIAFNLQKATKALAVIQQNPGKFFARYNFNEDGECIGFFYGQLESFIFSDHVIASEMFFYVREDHRGSPWFVKILREFEKWGKDNGAAQVKLSINAGIALDKTPRLFERLGYTQVGYIFDKEY